MAQKGAESKETIDSPGRKIKALCGYLEGGGGGGVSIEAGPSTTIVRSSRALEGRVAIKGGGGREGSGPGQIDKIVSLTCEHATRREGVGTLIPDTD